MKILPDTALTYDDVLLVPQYSDVDSRRLLSTKSCLPKDRVAIPIVLQIGCSDRDELAHDGS